MKAKIIMSLFGNAAKKRTSEREASTLFIKGEFAQLLKKNLKMPVSVMHL